MTKFVHLHVHSHYSLLDGLAKIPNLVARVKELGMDSVALTDHGVLYGAIEFYKTAKKAGIKPILGVEAYVAPRDRFSKEPSEKYYHLILLCENETGWKNLVKLVSKAHLEGFYYKPRVDKDLLREYHEGLIALSACLGGEIGQTLLAGRFEEAKKIALEYQSIFGENNYFLEIQKHPHVPESEKIESSLIKLSEETGIPLVAAQDIHYLRKEDAEYHDILCAIQTGNKLSDDDRLTLKEDDFSLDSPEEMAEKFAHILGAVERTALIAARCNVKLELGKVLLPDFPKPEGKTANQYLRELVAEWLPKKIPPEKQTQEVNDRLEYEIGVIEKTGFADYFLIVQDLIHWAKVHGIAVGPGRGSAAGSLVSYVLDITDIDPLTYGLLFERFLNPERIQMPDIDIDFADTRRDEVLAYAREKYGEDRVARIITFGTMAARAAIRDAGRAMGYAYGFCDQIAKLIPFNPTQGMKEGWLDECLKKVTELKALYDTNSEAKKLIDTARHLEGVARHASVHACGTVIAKEPLIERVPLQFAPQNKEIIITQFEMHAIEDLGLLKIDLLGLKNLTIIENTLRLIKELQDVAIDISKIPLDDKKTYELLQRGDTTGVFQFECLSGDTIVSNTTIKKLYERKNKNKLNSIYLDEGKVHKNNIAAIAKSGKKEVFALVAENGWHIKASADHQFLTADGWKTLRELKPGDKVFIKSKVKHLIFNLCETCGVQIDGQKKGTNRFCYRCSAKYYSNPSKPISRAKMKISRAKFFAAGGTTWNNGFTTENNEAWKRTAEKISRALTGKTFEDIYGREGAAERKAKMSQRFSGTGNPMFRKPSPHCKGGFRGDLGHYVRSNWEADFARILKFCGVTYQYEPQTFTLVGDDGLLLNYTPDFYVPSTNTFYEIKGWFHELDQKKVALFQKQYPQYHFELINTTRFAEFALQYKNLVAWECPQFPKRGYEFVAIEKIVSCGKEETYDIAMEAPGNNFVANGFVVHNSSGMRRYMKDIKPTELEDLIALVALFRPGPMELIPSFIKRKHGEEKITYLHPKLEPILKNTYGIGVYQEQMMQIARDLAGYTLPEADTLRKAIGKKIKSLLNEQKDKLINGMTKNGIPPKIVAAIWELFPPFARYGFNKCVTGDTLILDYNTGQLVRIENIVRGIKKVKRVVALHEDLKLKPSIIKNVFNNGVKQIYQVCTRSGRTIKATINHPFYGVNGWVPLENLKAGDRIAVPRVIMTNCKYSSTPDWKLATLGYLLAEGNLCHPHGVCFYSKNDEELRDYIAHMSNFGNTIATINKSKNAVSVYSKRKNPKLPSELVELVESLDLKFKKATEKYIPDYIFSLSHKEIAILLGKMFQGDGCIAINGKKVQIFYATSSKKLAHQWQHLLLRFGILSTIHAKKFKYRNTIKDGWTIHISRWDNIEKFIRFFAPHFVGQKKKTCEKILLLHPVLNGTIKKWAARGSCDSIPVSLLQIPLREAIAKIGSSPTRFSRETGVSWRLFHNDAKKRGYLRETIQKMTGALHNTEISNIAESDIFWDEIKEINDAGMENTYDIEVEGTHNFVANDFIVHNSHAACYAMIGYQTAYLKANYPEEFMAGLLNAEMNDIERISLLVQEARQSKIEILGPDVNSSFVNFTPEGSPSQILSDKTSEQNGKNQDGKTWEGNRIRFGLLAIKNVGSEITKAIIEERSRNGEFKNFEDFVMRVKHKDLNKKSIESLIKSGAFDSLGIERKQALENIDDILKFVNAAKRNTESAQNSLFGATAIPSATLKLKPVSPATNEEKLAWEKELIGFYLSEHPMSAYAEKISAYKARPIADLASITNERLIVRTAGLISKVRKILTKTGQPMLFATIEDLAQKSIEVIVFNSVLEKTMPVWNENNVVIVQGRMSLRDGQTKMICDNAKRLEA